MSTFHIGTLYAKPEHTEDLVASFEGLKQAQGYISHTCYHDVDNHNKITLVEEWRNKEDHSNFIKSFSQEKMEQWMGMLSAPAEDSFYTKA